MSRSRVNAVYCFYFIAVLSYTLSLLVYYYGSRSNIKHMRSEREWRTGGGEAMIQWWCQCVMLANTDMRPRVVWTPPCMQRKTHQVGGFPRTPRQRLEQLVHARHLPPPGLPGPPSPAGAGTRQRLQTCRVQGSGGSGVQGSGVRGFRGFRTCRVQGCGGSGVPIP